MSEQNLRQGRRIFDDLRAQCPDFATERFTGTGEQRQQVDVFMASLTLRQASMLVAYLAARHRHHEVKAGLWGGSRHLIVSRVKIEQPNPHDAASF